MPANRNNSLPYWLAPERQAKVDFSIILNVMKHVQVTSQVELVFRRNYRVRIVNILALRR